LETNLDILITFSTLLKLQQMIGWSIRSFYLTQALITYTCGAYNLPST